MRIQYDIMYEGSRAGGYYEKKSDKRESRKLLIDIMLKKYNISIQDLHDINIVKSKLRDVNIDEIIK